MKTCTICKTPKELDQFYKDGRKPMGVRSSCISCYVVRYPHKANTVGSKDASKRYKKSHKGIINCLLRGAIARSKKRNIEYDLDFQWLSEKMEPGLCEISGMQFQLPLFETKKGSAHPYSPSIDKIDAKGGYVKSNCRVVCFCVNMARSNWGDEILIRMCKSILENKAITWKD